MEGRGEGEFGFVSVRGRVRGNKLGSHQLNGFTGWQRIEITAQDDESIVRQPIEETANLSHAG